MGSRRKRFPLEPWLTAERDPGKERWFIRLGGSLLKYSGVIKSLSHGAFRLYVCMCCEAAGKRDFEFTHKTMEDYGLKSRSCWDYVRELEEAGLIERQSGKNLRKANKYRFGLNWKS